MHRRPRFLSTSCAVCLMYRPVGTTHGEHENRRIVKGKTRCLFRTSRSFIQRVVEATKAPVSPQNFVPWVLKSAADIAWPDSCNNRASAGLWDANFERRPTATTSFPSPPIFSNETSRRSFLTKLGWPTSAISGRWKGGFDLSVIWAVIRDLYSRDV